MIKSLPAFTLNRAFPLLGVSLIFSLIAHKNPTDLAIASYLLALFSIISAITSMLVATSGNITSLLINEEAKKRAFFTGGFTTALYLAAITLLLCSVALLTVVNFFNLDNIELHVFTALAMIYIPATTLLPLNVFLQLFHEANNKASHYSKIKIHITLVGSIFLIGAFIYTTEESFIYYAVSYFLITESLSFICLVIMSKGHGFISVAHARITAFELTKKGMPIATGIAGQKIYFYLIVERLTTSNIALAAQFSVLMNIINIIAIPCLALSQVHSLYISRQVARPETSYAKGLVWATALTLALMMFFSPVGHFIFSMYGNNTLSYSTVLYLAMTVFLFSNALLALTMAHLRAHNDTLLPQMAINIIMLAVVTPVFYMLSWEAGSVITLILIQSAAILFGAYILHKRITVFHKRHTQ
ncbi:hypothetical protein [Pseudomonas sp. 3A(2025)]